MSGSPARSLRNDDVQSTPPPVRRRLPLLPLVMLSCLAVVAVLAFLDADRDSSNALYEFGREQARLARSLAVHVSARLAEARRDVLIIEEASSAKIPIPPVLTLPYEDGGKNGSRLLAHDRRESLPPLAFITEGVSALEQPSQVLVLVRPPNGPLRAIDGRSVTSPAITTALDGNSSYARLDRNEARALGLAPRTAMVGLARIDGGALGHWDVAVAASAEQLRDREWWARWRLVLTVTAAGVLVFLFGGVALRNQRRELVAEHALAVVRIEKAQEARLQSAARTATLGTLAIGVAHEISTPLGVISGRAEQLLERLRGDERGERAASIVLEQTEGIGRVIKGLLQMARGRTPEFVPVEPDAILDGAAQMTAHKFAAAGVHLEVIPSGEDVHVLGDQRLLEHAVVNLLINACDASPKGSRVVAETTREPGAIVFSVTDEGQGISEENARRVLEPFFTTKSNGKGTGLGLAIAREIVASHRGTLSLRRGDAKGTVALISIPLAEKRRD